MKKILCISLIFSILISLPTLLTLKPLIVLSASMTPLLGVGDLVIVKPADPSQLKVGDIIAFKDPEGRGRVLITHRIVNITEEGFRTKGDAVEDPDPFVVKKEDVVGKVVFVLPYLGYFFDWAKRKEAFFIFILFPSALIIGDEIRKLRAYTNPLLEARMRKMEEKRIKVNHTFINYPRMLFIFFLAFALFSFLFLPHMLQSGYQVREKTIHAGIFPASVIIKQEGSPFPQYRLLTPFSSLTVQEAQSVSVAPGFCVYWHKLLAFSPQFPAIAYTVFFSLLAILLSMPLWKRPAYQKRIKRIKDRRRLL